MENEKWIKIENSKEYFISNCGRVKRGAHKRWCVPNNTFSNVKERLLTPCNNNSKKYWRITIRYDNNTTKTESVHRLVALHFISNNNSLKNQVNHLDGDKNNNNVTNLEWVTNLENNAHKHLVLKKFNYKEGSDCNFSKLTEKQVLQIPTLLSQGLTNKKIAVLFKVSESTISEIRNGRSWNYLKLFPYKMKKSNKYNLKELGKI